MEKLEETVRKSMKSTRLQLAILRSAESLKLLTTAGLSGSVYKMYKILDREERRRKYRSILAARERLIENKCLKWEGKHIVLTEIGRKILQSGKTGVIRYPVLQSGMESGECSFLIFRKHEKHCVKKSETHFAQSASNGYRIVSGFTLLTVKILLHYSKQISK